VTPIVLRLNWIVVLITGLVCSLAGAASLPSAISLQQHVSITADANSPAYVQYAVQDLAGYLKELTGDLPSMAETSKRDAGVVIGIGAQTAERILGEKLPAEKLGAEGYLLKSFSKDGAEYIVVAGATPRGTRAGMAALMKAIHVDDHSVTLPDGMDIVSKPAFPRRGMHFNGWAFNYPYSFRGWKEADWKNYIDILSYQNVNLLYLWPFMEIMPVPLSKEDQAYLEECNRVVEYAQQKHGMEVWIMQCTNRVASSRLGVADPRLRPYWRPEQKDLNPGDPKDYQAIMDSREALYKGIPSADGVCNIDSDPGEWPGSPISDYVKVLNGCRVLLDKYNVHGKDTKIISWMWTGWGTDQKHWFDRHQQLLSIQALKKGLPEPWELIAGQNSFLPICRDEKVLEKTILLQYGLIEGEPAYPMTDIRMNAMRDAFGKYILKYPQISGVMGNLQTPLLQFPEMFFFTTNIWDPDYRTHSNQKVLSDVAALLYPEHAQAVADGFLALQKTDLAQTQAAIDELEPLVVQNKLGRAGVFGRKLFPDRVIVAKETLLQLRYRAAQMQFVQIPAKLSEDEYAKRVEAYFDAYLAWDREHGWHLLWGWKESILGNKFDKPYLSAAARIARSLGSPAAVQRCFDQVSKALIPKYGEAPVNQGCIAPMKQAMIEGLTNLAMSAKASASVLPEPTLYPAGAAIDGDLSTRYWPGALIKSNTEWLQLTWQTPQTFDKVVVYFLQYPTMPGRRIHLQKESAPDQWEDFAVTAIPKDSGNPYATATFQLPTKVTADKIRIVNLLDLFEVEIR
jgi:hypothetical protein